MKGGMMKGLITGMLIGGSAAMVYGVMNWQKEKEWNRQARKTGSWISEQAENLARKF